MTIFVNEKARHPVTFTCGSTPFGFTRNRASIKELLEYEIRQRCPAEFTPDINPKRFVSVGWEIEFPEDLGLLPDILLKPYVALISAFHPILVQTIDTHQFTESGIEERPGAVGNFGVRHPDALKEYSRSISKTLRSEVISRSGGACAHCKSPFSDESPHIDHILPFPEVGRLFLSTSKHYVLLAISPKEIVLIINFLQSENGISKNLTRRKYIVHLMYENHHYKCV